MQWMQINKKGTIKLASKNDQCSTNIRNQTGFSAVTVQAETSVNLWISIAWGTLIGINFIKMDQLEGGKVGRGWQRLQRVAPADSLENGARHLG